MPVKTYLINKVNSEKYRLNGILQSSRLPNKRHLCKAFCDHMLLSAQQLPPKVDLRAGMTPVEDQSSIGSCAANCLAGSYEYLTKKVTGRDIDISRLFIYYNARVKDQRTTNVVDTGCTMTSAIESLEQFGTCLESVWPYDVSRVNTRPSDQAYAQAKRNIITEALRVNITLNEMKSCLAQGFPFAFGILLYSSFDQAARTGVVPMPNVWETGRQQHGSHALLAVGYSDQSRAFIVRNSWGSHWGDQGYCYIPYDYLSNPKYCFDAWVIRKVGMDDLGHEYWDNFDSINYATPNNLAFNNNFNNNNAVIQSFNVDDDDNFNNNDYGRNRNNRFNRRDDFNNPWGKYRDYRGSSRNEFGMDRDYRFDRRNDFYNPGDQYRSNKRNNFSRNDDHYGMNQNNGFDQRNDFNQPWNQYHGGKNNRRDYDDDDYDDDYSNDDDDQYPNQFGGYSGGGNFPYPPHNDNNSFGFGGGPSNFNPNANFYNNNQFGFSAPSYQPGAYGSSYGYANPYNNSFNPFF